MALRAETVYRVTEDDGTISWAYSPDGEGCIWYDTREDATDNGYFPVSYFAGNSDEFEIFRYDD